MSNYSINKVGKKYIIKENKTGYELYETHNKAEAHKKLAFLNMGGAFDGWTPSFFLTEIPENYYESVE